MGVPGTLPECEADSEVIVVDNASGDGLAQGVRERFPGVQVIESPENVGIEAFNIGARAAQGDVLLILDDDAWPDAGVLVAALKAMRVDHALAAIALLPVHPKSGQAEWPFVTRRLDAFAFMGCANLVRKDAWLAAGGYESAYFLYRNDTDLALTLGAMGLNVRCDPAWRAWHDSPNTGAKSERWLTLATRNWLWLCRRHARGAGFLLGVMAGLARAIMHAGVSPRRLACVGQGAWRGVFSPAPLPRVAATGEAFSRHLAQRQGRPSQ